MSDRHDFENPDAERFVGDVLSRTTGAACGRATAQLADLMSDRLSGLDRQLVQAHLEHCAGCRNLAVTMGWLTPLLPQMAEFEPGPDFMAGVLARTSQVGHVARPDAPLGGAAGLMDRVGRWWSRRILRPQFALQAAYAATVVLVLLTATPYSPLRGLPHRALQVVTAGPGSAPVVGPALARTSGWVDVHGAALVDGGRTRVANRWQHLNESLAARVRRTTGSRSELDNHWHNLVAQARARELGGVGYELLAGMRTVGVVWRQWWHDDVTENGS